MRRNASVLLEAATAGRVADSTGGEASDYIQAVQEAVLTSEGVLAAYREVYGALPSDAPPHLSAPCTDNTPLPALHGSP
jgi:hypothetical protein